MSAGGAWGADEAAQRAQIAAERSAAQARFERLEAQCRERFAVTGCIDDARRERRAAIDALALRERTLDDAARKRRAAQRIAEIEARQKAPLPAVRTDRQVTTRGSGPGRSEEAPDSAAGAAGAASAAPPHPRPSVTLQSRREREAAKRAEFEQRQRIAEQHRRESEQRRAAGSAKKPSQATAPLPVPEAASGPSPQVPDAARRP